MVEVEYLGENKTFSPQEISAMVLTKVRTHRKSLQSTTSELTISHR